MPSKTDIQSAMRPYPMLNKCFASYVDWIFAESNREPTDFDLVWYVDRVITGLSLDQQLDSLETLLNESQRILHLSEPQFLKRFSFRTALRDRTDPDKINDLFAEIIAPVDLTAYGFTDFCALKAGTRPGRRSADFIAHRNSQQTAIEVKSVRPNPNKGPDGWMYDPTSVRQGEVDPRREVHDGIRCKIDAARDQLIHTQEDHNCTDTLLFIVHRHRAIDVFVPIDYLPTIMRNATMGADVPAYLAVKYQFRDPDSSILFHPELPPLITPAPAPPLRHLPPT